MEIQLDLDIQLAHFVLTMKNWNGMEWVLEWK